MVLKPILGWLWRLIHMAISLFDLCSCLSNKLECYVISSELLSKYQILHLERLKCLGVILDSREAKNVTEVKQLLHWFSTAGIKYVVLYDIEGVIKESIEPGIEASREDTSNFSDVCANTKSPHCSHGEMVIECLSGSDGKESIAKAANLLYSASCKGCSTYTTCIRGYDKMDFVFTEADMASALRAVGSGRPEPDLLLVYGPVRCHLGFPAWRLRYTEIMYMTVDTYVKEDPFVVYKDRLPELTFVNSRRSCHSGYPPCTAFFYSVEGGTGFGFIGLENSQTCSLVVKALMADGLKHMHMEIEFYCRKIN